MTTSVSTRSAGRLNPTRQQLDELDALLQRMLDLPVHPLDDAEQAEVEEAVEEPLPPVLNSVRHPEPADEPIAQEPAEELLSSVMNSIEQPADAELSPGDSAARPTVSYMVIETASPRPLPPASGFEPRQPTPVLVPVSPQPEPPAPTQNQEWGAEIEEPEVHKEEHLSPFESLLPPHFGPSVDEPPVPESDADEMWVPLRSTWQPSPQTWPPLAESWHQANGGAPPFAAAKPLPIPRLEPALPPAPVQEQEQEVRIPEPNVSAEEQPSSPAPLEQPRLSLSPEDAPATVPLLLLPLLWFNQGFDACFAPLGAPGRWMCENGRSLLGLLGLACLAAAAIIAVSARMAWPW